MCANESPVATAPGETAVGDFDDCSSYGTGDTTGEANVETRFQNAPGGLLDRLDGMRTSMVAVVAGQDAILNRLLGLEKVVAIVGVDMAWVREDVGVVHEVIDKMADHVSFLSKSETEGNDVGAKGHCRR